MLYIHTGIRVYSCELALFCAHQVVLSINLCFIAYNIEMSLEDLMYENVRVKNYLQDHVIA